MIHDWLLLVPGPGRRRKAAASVSTGVRSLTRDGICACPADEVAFAGHRRLMVYQLGPAVPRRGSPGRPTAQ